MTGFVIVKAQIDDLRLRSQHLHYRNWGRAAAGNLAVLLPLVWIHGDIRQHINGRFKHIKAPVRAGMMETVTWVAGLDVQPKGFAKAVRAAQMGVARAAAFIRADEHSVVMCRILVEQFSACKVRNNISVQTARFEKIREYTVHIRVRNGRREGLLIDLFQLFCLRINRLHALAQQHGHRFNVTLAIIFLYEADRSTALVRGMVEPLAAAHRDAVVACKPLFPAGFDESFALPEKKFFEVNGRGAFFLLWCKFDKFADKYRHLSFIDCNLLHFHIE